VAASTGMASSGSVSNTENTNIDINGNVIIQGSTTPKSLAEQLKERRY
jgi:hypothetical protein